MLSGAPAGPGEVAGGQARLPQGAAGHRPLPVRRQVAADSRGLRCYTSLLSAEKHIICECGNIFHPSGRKDSPKNPSVGCPFFASDKTLHEVATAKKKHNEELLSSLEQKQPGLFIRPRGQCRVGWLVMVTQTLEELLSAVSKPIFGLIDPFWVS